MGIQELQNGSTVRTAVGLGVKSPITWAAILCLAWLAHFKLRHGRVLPVIGQASHNRIPWSAIRAADKRVLIPLVAGRVELLHAAFAHRDIHRQEIRGPKFRRACLNRKIGIAEKRLRIHPKFSNLGIFRGFSLQRMGKGADAFFAPFDINQNSGTLIFHPSLKPEPVRRSVNKGSKTDPLHNSGQCNEIPLCITHNYHRLCF